jgi:hypothetical protein
VRAINAWTCSIKHDEMVMHAVQYSVAVHKDLVGNQLVESSTKEALWHKGTILHLLRQRLLLNTSKPSDTGAMFYTVWILATHELDREIMESMASADPMAFSALMPPPNGIRVYRKLDVTAIHGWALQLLLNRGST